MVKHKENNNLYCQKCGRAFSRPNALERHLREKHRICGGTKRRHSAETTSTSKFDIAETLGETFLNKSCSKITLKNFKK